MANLTIEQLTSFTGTPQSTDLIIIHDGTNAKKITYGELFNKIISGSTELQADGSQFNLTGHIIPTVNSQYDLGSAEYKFRDLYLSSNSIHVGDQTLSETNIDDSMEIKNILIPSSSNSEGKKGDVVFDETHMYVCIDTNSWKRILLDSNW
jgi:hypothetical protein